MSGFLYFKPGESAVNAEKAKAWGLGYAFSTRASGGQCQGQTPSGGAGIVFADKQRMGDSPIKMDMPNQVWGKIPKSDVWVGYWKDAPPTPESLQRDKQLPGYSVALADDKQWTVPLVHQFDVDSAELVSALPCYMTCNEAGEWVRENVVAIHAHLWDLLTPFADDIWKTMSDPSYEARNFTVDEILGAVTTLLQSNYFVGPGELSLLHAFCKDSSAHEAILSACDFPVLWAWNEDQKKTSPQSELDGQSTGDGKAA